MSSAARVFAGFPVDPRSGGSVQNWSRTFSFKPAVILQPKDVPQVQAIVREARKHGFRVSVLGSGHSPAELVKQTDVLLSLNRLDRVIQVDENGLATLEAGATLKSLNERLERLGWAFSSLGSISEQTIAGAVATSTHGTGLQFGTLSSMVTGMELVMADGSVCWIDESSDQLDAYRVHLGMLGVVTKVQIKLERAFRLKAEQSLHKLGDLLEHLDHHLSAGEHVRFWWVPHTDDAVLWRASRTSEPIKPIPPPPDRLDNTLHQRLLYISTYMPWLTPFLNRMWFRRSVHPYTRVDKSYKVFNFDCLYHQDVSEWAIPRHRCAEALKKLQEMIATKGYRVHAPVEVRFVKGDRAWMSPCFERDVCYIGIIMYRPYDRGMPDQENYFYDFCRLMRNAFDGRPHLAKPHLLSYVELWKAYPKLPLWLEIKQRTDPGNVFGNASSILRLEKEGTWLGSKL